MTADLLSIGSLGYLARLCRRWGGEILFMPMQEFHALPFADPWAPPFTDPWVPTNGITRGSDMVHAVDWPNRKVIAVEHQHNCGQIIHEMGHVFLAEAEPTNGEEIHWLGWEIALARRSRCYRLWSKQNARYTVNWDDAHEWQDLSGDRLRRFVADRISHAQTLGIVSQDGEPLCTRRAITDDKPRDTRQRNTYIG